MRYLVVVIYDMKIADIENQYITTANYNKVTKNVVAERVKKKKQFLKNPVIVHLVNNTDLNKLVATLAIKVESKAGQDKIMKVQTFNSSYLCGKSHFIDDGTQNNLVFQTLYRYFKKIFNADCVSLWKFKGLSDEII